MEYVVLVVGIASIVSILTSTIYYGIGPMPASKQAINAMLSCVGKQQDVYELGAGFGGVAIRAAQRFPQKNICAYEGSPLPFFICWLRALRYANLRVRLCNFERLDFVNGTCLLCYLSPVGMKRLSLSLSNWSGTLISYEFALRPHTPTHTIELSDLYRSKVFSYQIVTA